MDLPMNLRVQTEQALKGIRREANDKHISHLLSAIAGWLHIAGIAWLLLVISLCGC